MYLIFIAWIYVAVMMALAEATSAQGTWLGALFTLILYGLLPLAILMYILHGPARRRARAQNSSAQTNESTQTTAGPQAPGVPPMGKE